MGRRGPAAKPTVLKLIAGNPGKRPLNAAEPVPPAGEPDKPDWLDADAAQVWAQIVPRLARIGLARSIDGWTLGRYCALFVLWREAYAFVRENGSKYPIRADPTTAGEPGRIVGFREWTEAAVCRKLNQQLLQLEREFGLTPAARTRITVDAEKGAKGDANELKKKFFLGGA